MLNEWDKKFPGRIETMFRATQNITPSHLCDTKSFDFKGISKGDEVINGGDIAFDREEIPLNSFDASEIAEQDLILWKEIN